MFTRTVTLFKLFGFAVRIDISWLVILVLVVWSLAAGVFPAQYKGLPSAAYLAMGLAGAFALFASIVFHELSHSLVARRFGLPIRGITLFLFGGVAEMAGEPPSAKAEFFMAAAGPLSSVVLALAFLGVSFVGADSNWPAPVVGVLRWAALINGMLAVFNLIPGVPLDGGRILRSILWHLQGDLRRATRIAATVGAGFGMLLIAMGFVNLLFAQPLGGLWWILIGMFLRGAARQSYRQVVIRQSLRGEPVSRFMNPDPVAVAPHVSIEDLVENYIYRYHFRSKKCPGTNGRTAAWARWPWRARPTTRFPRAPIRSRPSTG